MAVLSDEPIFVGMFVAGRQVLCHQPAVMMVTCVSFVVIVQFSIRYTGDM